MEYRPLVNVDGSIYELPQGGTVAGVPGVSAWKEPVSVWNNGSPEIVFSSDGEVVMSDAS